MKSPTIPYQLKRLPRFSICLAAATLAPLAVQAQAIWTGEESDVYMSGGNWSTGTPPTSLDEVLIDNSDLNPAVHASGNLERFANTTISGTGQLAINSGRFINGNSTFTVSGGSFTHTGEYFLVGHTGVGHFVQSGGTVTTNHSRGFFLSNNESAESGSSYTLSGGTLIVNSTAGNPPPEWWLRSVWFGKGSGGASPLVGDKFHATGGTAIFTRTGTNEAGVMISRNSKIQVSGTAEVTFADYSHFYVGYNNAGTTGNEIIVDGGTLTISGETNLDVGFEDSGKLTISAGVFSLEGYLIIGGSGEGLVTMTGGLASLGGITHNSGTFDFSGGILKIEGDYSSIVDESWFNTAGAPEGVSVEFDPVSNITTIVAVPEPATFLLAAAGLAVVTVFKRRRHS